MAFTIDYAGAASEARPRRRAAYVVGLTLNATAAAAYTVAFVSFLRRDSRFGWTETACAGLLVVFPQLLLSSYGASVFGSLPRRRWWDPLPWVSALALVLLVLYECIVVLKIGPATNVAAW